MNPIDIILRAILDAKGFKEAQKENTAVTQTAERATKALKTEAQEVSKGFDGAAKSAHGLAEAVKAGIGIDIGGRITSALASIPDKIMDGVRAGIEFNATIEQQTIAFDTLLGSVSKAEERVRELFDFAARTPFGFEEVVQADRVLQVFGGDALAAAEGLRMVGDTASSTTRPLQEAAMWMGRVFAGLESGTAIGEATLRLIEMGAITGEQAREINALAESGRGVGRAMEIMGEVFSRHAGAMEKQSRSLNGQVSTLKDNFQQLAGTMTGDLTEAVKFWTGALNTMVQSEGFKGLLKVMSGLTPGGPLNQLAKDLGTLSAGGDQSDPAKGMRGLGVFDLRRPGTLTPPAPAESEAEKKLMEELRKQRADALLDERQKVELWYGEQQRLINENFQDRERKEAALAILRETHAARVAEFEKQNEEAIQELREELARENEQAAAKTAQENAERLRRELQFEQDQLRIARDDVALRRAQLDADFSRPEIEKRGERIRLLKEEIEAIDTLMRKLEARRDAEKDAAAQEALNQQVMALGNEKRALDTQVAGAEGAADPASFRQQFRDTITDLEDQWGSAAQQMANSFREVFNGAISSISNGITGLIMGTQTWGQALLNIGMNIIQSIIQAIVQMGVRWVMTQIMMSVAGKAIQASMIAANAPIAMASAAMWAGPATLATIASYGAAAAAAPAFITASQAAVMASSVVGAAGFKAGGYTGDGDPNAVAGPAHKGEFYFTAPQTKAIGVENLQTMARSATAGGGWGGMGGAIAAAMQNGGGGQQQIDNSVNIAPVMHPDAIGQWAESTKGRKFIADIARGVVMEMQPA